MKRLSERCKVLHLELMVMIAFSFLGEEIGFGKERAKVFLVKSRSIASYNIAVEGFRRHSPGEWNIVEYDLRGTVRNADEMMRRIESEKPDLVVAVGAKALVALTRWKCTRPMVFCMVMNPTVYELQGFNATGVFLAVSPEEQLKILVSLNPEIRRVGLLLREQRQRDILSRVTYLGEKYGIKLIPMEIGSEKEIPQKLRATLGRVEALWMLDDSFIHDKQTLDFVILKTLENELAFMAISKVFVKEGALISLSPSFFSNGSQAAQMAKRVLMKRMSPRDIPVSYHKDPDLVINLKIARKIGLDIPAELLDKAKRIYE